uniref:uncharacterized protein LOC114605856 isoform X2 n=1 Tax=Podarcis muralis TaxID=64176 RepID=UPI0010A0208F|nr:uncharacterized protein LOC114605856 isoform X2 [Podarcis muralis]
MIVKEVYHHLHRISDSSTKEETLSAVVSLATKCLSPVVDSLLECSAECNERAAAMWKALAADPYSSSKLMKPILQRLQDKDPNYMRCSMSQTPNSGPYSHHPQKSTRTLPDNMCHPNTKKRAIGMFQDLVHIIHRRVQEHCQTGTGIYASSQLEEKSHRDGILLGGPCSHHPQKSTRTLPDNMCHPNTKKRAIGKFQDLVHIIPGAIQAHFQTGT